MTSDFFKQKFPRFFLALFRNRVAHKSKTPPQNNSGPRRSSNRNGGGNLYLENREHFL